MLGGRSNFMVFRFFPLSISFCSFIVQGSIVFRYVYVFGDKELGTRSSKFVWLKTHSFVLSVLI